MVQTKDTPPPYKTNDTAMEWNKRGSAIVALYPIYNHPLLGTYTNIAALMDEAKLETVYVTTGRRAMAYEEREQ